MRNRIISLALAAFLGGLATTALSHAKPAPVRAKAAAPVRSIGGQPFGAGAEWTPTRASIYPLPRRLLAALPQPTNVVQSVTFTPAWQRISVNQDQSGYVSVLWSPQGGVAAGPTVRTYSFNAACTTLSKEDGTPVGVVLPAGVCTDILNLATDFNTAFNNCVSSGKCLPNG